MLTGKVKKTTMPAISRRYNKELRTNLAGYLFISPWLLGFFMFTIGPMIVSLYLAFNSYNYITEIKWVGFDNFKRMFTADYHFWNSLTVTFKYVFIRQPIFICQGLAIALLLNKIKKGSSFYRTLYYIPSIVGGGVAISVMWRMILSRDGLFNQILALFGIAPVSWLNNPDIALYSLILTSLYTFGGIMVIFLAGLKNIPENLYEAATIDGAGSMRKFIHITIPLLSPVIFFNVIMGIINGFQTFTSAFIITRGGPMGRTTFYMLNLYSQAFEYHRAGYASALAWVLFWIILFFTMIVFKSSSLWVFYESNVKTSKQPKKARKSGKGSVKV